MAIANNIEPQARRVHNIQTSISLSHSDVKSRRHQIEEHTQSDLQLAPVEILDEHEAL